MEKVYVVECDWANEANNEYYEEYSDIVAVMKDEQEARAMCRRLRKEKLSQLSADEPDYYKYDLIDKDDICGDVCWLHVDAHYKFVSGTFFWLVRPYDVIES